MATAVQAPTVPRILIVDDDEALGEALTGLFQHAGYQARHAPTGSQALAMVRSEAPNLAVVDVRLGPESGLNLVPVLRALLPDMAIIVLTAVATADTMSEAFRRGADSFACKSIDPPHLLELVAAGLRTQSERRGAS